MFLAGYERAKAMARTHDAGRFAALERKYRNRGLALLGCSLTGLLLIFIGDPIFGTVLGMTGAAFRLCAYLLPAILIVVPGFLGHALSEKLEVLVLAKRLQGDKTV